MTAHAHTLGFACPRCGNAADVQSRHVAVADGAVRIYCSAECLRLRDTLPIEPLEPRRRRAVWLLAPLLFVGLMLSIGLFASSLTGLSSR